MKTKVGGWKQESLLSKDELPPRERPRRCNYCETTNYALPDGEGKLICFPCLRAQWRLYRGTVARLQAEVERWEKRLEEQAVAWGQSLLAQEEGLDGRQR